MAHTQSLSPLSYTHTHTHTHTLVYGEIKVRAHFLSLFGQCMKMMSKYICLYTVTNISYCLAIKLCSPDFSSWCCARVVVQEPSNLGIVARWGRCAEL